MKLALPARFSLWHLSILAAAAAVLLVQIAAPGQGAKSPQPAKAGQGKDITIYQGSSQVVRSPWPVKRVAVTDPKIADVRVLSPRQVLLQGKAIGSTDLVLWSDKEEIWRARVHVEIDLARIRAELRKLFPDTTLDVKQSREVLVVTGSLSRVEQVQQLRKLLEAYQVKYVDMTDLAGVQQVLLKVRIAEVSRRAIRALGINALKTDNDFFGASTIGASAGGAINPIHIGPAAGSAAAHGLPFTFTNDVNVSSSVTLFGGFQQINLELFIQALAENQYLRILAEPNLVALSGQDASFLAGGEFPIPVVQGTTAGGSSVTIEYRQYGVQLKFRPTVLGNGTIRLYVAPTVSEMSDTGAVEIQGFSIPSIVTRQVETTLELKSHQTFAMAGLISRTTTARVSRVPGLGDLPVLGALFRSVRYTSGETELVVLVTASLVEPLSLKDLPPSPGMFHIQPNDWELYLLGKIEGKTPPRIAPADAEWLTELGLNRLKGPGAWARYEQGVAYSRAPMASPAARSKP